MDVESLAAIGTGAGTLVAAFFAAYQATRAKSEAAAAKDLSTPTGNGFAKYTKDALARIENDLMSVASKVDMNAASIGKIESRLERYEDRLDRHIDRQE